MSCERAEIGGINHVANQDGSAEYPLMSKLAAYERSNPVVQAQCMPDDQGRYEECTHGRNYWMCDYPRCKILRGGKVSGVSGS